MFEYSLLHILSYKEEFLNPPEGVCESSSPGGFYLLIYGWGGVGGNTIAKRCHQHSYEFQKLMSSWGVWVRFSFTGWLMDGWVDGTEYQKCPSIFFIFTS